jgi:hypothetical protein
MGVVGLGIYEEYEKTAHSLMMECKQNPGLVNIVADCVSWLFKPYRVRKIEPHREDSPIFM